MCTKNDDTTTLNSCLNHPQIVSFAWSLFYASGISLYYYLVEATRMRDLRKYRASFSRFHVRLGSEVSLGLRVLICSDDDTADADKDGQNNRCLLWYAVETNFSVTGVVYCNKYSNDMRSLKITTERDIMKSQSCHNRTKTNLLKEENNKDRSEVQQFACVT